MAISSGLTDTSKQIAADAVFPPGHTFNVALIAPGAAGTYDETYTSAYVLGLGGDEVVTGNGYTQGGLVLTGRIGGPTSPYGWVAFDDALWTAVGSLKSIGAVIYDVTDANRVVMFISFGGIAESIDAPFRVKLPLDAGPGVVRFR